MLVYGELTLAPSMLVYGELTLAPACWYMVSLP